MTLRLVIPRKIIGQLHESAPVSFAGLVFFPRRLYPILDSGEGDEHSMVPP